MQNKGYHETILYFSFMILITGGTGLLGSHLLYRLSLKSEPLRAIYRTGSDLGAVKSVFRLYSDDFEKLFNKIEWFEADITDVFALKSAFKEVSHVYHVAAMVSFAPKDYAQLRKINIEGTANIVNFCVTNSVEKLCYVSSIATIESKIDKMEMDESHTWSSQDLKSGYSISKFGAEMEVWRGAQEGIATVIVNPGIILGPGFWQQGSGSIFKKVYKGLKFYSEGITGFVSVEDVVSVMCNLMKEEVENERFILVAENRSFKDIFFLIADNFGLKRPSIRVTRLMTALAWRLEYLKTLLNGKNPLLTKHSANSIHEEKHFSSEKIKQLLGFEFESISSTVRKVCSAYRSTI
jgi:nucleoside-diphosphate-sugar epimerase